MKLWIDAQLSPMLAKWINENFATVEAIAVRDLGLRDAEDQVIFFSAREANATVMTKDSDFLELQKRLGVPPKIIWVTCGNTCGNYWLSLQEEFIGVVAWVESLPLAPLGDDVRGRNSAFEPREAERQVEVLFESLLAEAFA